MITLEVPHKQIDKIKGYENYNDYIVDIQGNVYSIKFNKIKKLKPNWARDKNNPYLKIRLRDVNGSEKSFYIHHLVRNAFLPEEINKKRIRHKGCRQDNSLENLGFYEKKKKKIVSAVEYSISEETINQIKLIHQACMEKGLHTTDSFTFVNEVVNEMLEEYVNRKGLKKILYRLKNENHSDSSRM